MKAAVYEKFGAPLSIRELADPSPSDSGVVIKVKASGLCRSDFHGWLGHDPTICLPHVPGHEMSGIIETIGKKVQHWKTGDRVTLPFVCGCGTCPQCVSGNHQVCDHQFQPGFTAWGSYAEYVAIEYADINLVRVPDAMDFKTAAILGCRFVTSFRAVTAQGKITKGQWLAVHGCGGVGLSAIMIANAFGAKVVAIDIKDEVLELARSLGAAATINSTKEKEVIENVKDITQGGAHVSIDALGNPDTSFNSVSNLRKRGKHIQVGLLSPKFHNVSLPMDKIIANELEVIGSHGMQAHKYPELLEMIVNGELQPEKLIGKTISLQQAANYLVNMDSFSEVGITVINTF